MRRVRLIGVVLLGLVLGVLPAGSGNAAPGAQHPVPVRVMPFGASSTEGVGSPETAGYRRPLLDLLAARDIPVDLVGSRSTGPAGLGDREHEGHSGWTAAQLAEHAEDWVRAADPDVILLHAGTNDLLRGASVHTVVRRLDVLLDRIYQAAPDVHVIMAGVWAKLPARHALDDRLAGLAAVHRARGRSITAVRTGDLLARSDLVDGLHPGPNGYQRIARMWEREIVAYWEGKINP